MKDLFGNESPVSDKKREIPAVPSKDDVHQWIQRDISAASYFLAMLLRYPDIMKNMAADLYAEVLRKEQGAAIDHVKQKGDGLPG